MVRPTLSLYPPVAWDNGPRLWLLWCPVPLTVRGTQVLVGFAPLAPSVFCAARRGGGLPKEAFIIRFKPKLFGLNERGRGHADATDSSDSDSEPDGGPLKG